MAKSNLRSYFTHDSGARNSEKLIRARMRHGAAGYGVYFMILERLRDENEYMSVKDYNMIAFDLRVDAALIKSIVEDFGLFVFTEDGKYFYSEEFSRRMGIKDETASKLSEAGKKGMARRYANNAEEFEVTKLENHNEVITRLPQNDNKVITRLPKNDNKKSKEKKSKENNTPPQTPPQPGGVCPSQAAEEEVFETSYQKKNAKALTDAVTAMGGCDDYVQELLRMSNDGDPSSPVWYMLDYAKNSNGKFDIASVVRSMSEYEKQGRIKCKSAQRSRLELAIQRTVKPEEVGEILQALTIPEREQRCLQAIEEVRKSNGRIRLPAKYILAELQKVQTV